MKLLMHGLLVLGAALLTGCVATSSYDFSAYHERQPTSILVLPVVNESVDVQAPTSVLTTLPRALGEKGYYVFPVHTVKTLLEYEGLYEPAVIHEQPTGEIAELFGADTVLYVTIHEWASRYVVVSTTTVVDFEYRLVAADGTPLWSARKELQYTPDSGNSGGSAMAQLLSAAVTAAVERADPNYLPLTRQANQEVFYTDRTAIPPGPYRPEYQEYYQNLEAGQESDQ